MSTKNSQRMQKLRAKTLLTAIRKVYLGANEFLNQDEELRDFVSNSVLKYYRNLEELEYSKSNIVDTYEFLDKSLYLDVNRLSIYYNLDCDVLYELIKALIDYVKPMVYKKDVTVNIKNDVRELVKSLGQVIDSGRVRFLEYMKYMDYNMPYIDFINDLSDADILYLTCDKVISGYSLGTIEYEFVRGSWDFVSSDNDYNITFLRLKYITSIRVVVDKTILNVFKSRWQRWKDSSSTRGTQVSSLNYMVLM